VKTELLSVTLSFLKDAWKKKFKRKTNDGNFIIDIVCSGFVRCVFRFVLPNLMMLQMAEILPRYY